MKNLYSYCQGKYYFTENGYLKSIKVDGSISNETDNLDDVKIAYYGNKTLMLINDIPVFRESKLSNMFFSKEELKNIKNQIDLYNYATKNSISLEILITENSQHYRLNKNIYLTNDFKEVNLDIYQENYNDYILVNNHFELVKINTLIRNYDKVFYEYVDMKIDNCIKKFTDIEINTFIENEITIINDKKVIVNQNKYFVTEKENKVYYCGYYECLININNEYYIIDFNKEVVSKIEFQCLNKFIKLDDNVLDILTKSYINIFNILNKAKYFVLENYCYNTDILVYENNTLSLYKSNVARDYLSKKTFYLKSEMFLADDNNNLLGKVRYI